VFSIQVNIVLSFNWIENTLSDTVIWFLHRWIICGRRICAPQVNFYGIFLRMIHHLLWMSRHQKRGDLPADLQRAVGGKDLNGRKAFPRSDPQNENII
jgi:hypothetical protein